MWSRENPRELFAEYFYNKLSKVDLEIDDVVYAIRTKKGVLILCDKLRVLEAEKSALITVYEDLRVFFL